MIDSMTKLRQVLSTDTNAPAATETRRGHTADGGAFLSLGPDPQRPGGDLISVVTSGLVPGVKLDRFTVKCPLSRGRTSAVYLAGDAVRSTDVAIKVMAPGRDGAVFQEHTVSDLVTDFTHVLRTYDVFKVPWSGIELLVLSMEYAAGGNLRKWLSDHQEDAKLRRTQGLAYFRQICRGVAAIHCVGAVHRDLKPENVLLVDGTVKVADLGASSSSLQAALHAASDAADHAFDLGTPTYMAPEQFTAAHPDDPDARADIYSLGILLYEILHPRGRPAFGGSFARLRQMHTQVAPPPLSGADQTHVRVVRRCLEKDPADRYPSVGELLDDLDGRADDAPIDPEIERSQRVETTWQERHCTASSSVTWAARWTWLARSWT